MLHPSCTPCGPYKFFIWINFFPWLYFEPQHRLPNIHNWHHSLMYQFISYNLYLFQVPDGLWMVNYSKLQQHSELYAQRWVVACVCMPNLWMKYFSGCTETSSLVCCNVYCLLNIGPSDWKTHVQATFVYKYISEIWLFIVTCSGEFYTC